MQTEWIQTASALLNPLDLILIAILLFFLISGLRRGFSRTLCGVLGRLIGLAATFFAARALAPVVARLVVTPIVGSLFESQAELSQAAGVLDGLRQTVEEAAAGMAESIAFLFLIVIFGILFGFLISVALHSLRFLTRHTPLAIPDALAGGAVGLAAGVVLIAAFLVCLEWVYPIAYSPLGWLSPERVQHTVLLARLIDVLPVAI